MSRRYVISIVVEWIDEDDNVSDDFVSSYQWEGSNRKVRSFTEADRIASVLSVAKVPGA